jgi:hypothetical protein
MRIAIIAGEDGRLIDIDFRARKGGVMQSSDRPLSGRGTIPLHPKIHDRSFECVKRSPLAAIRQPQ